MPRTFGSTDRHALRLIAAGRILADPATGVILVDGQPRGSTSRNDGYNRIYCDGVTMPAHRIVWMFVNGPIPAGHVINHRDGNRRNNRIDNLEAITHRQNVLHGIRHRDYRGTFPDEPPSPEVQRLAEELAVRDDVSRDEVLALIRDSDDPEEWDDGGIAMLMTTYLDQRVTRRGMNYA